MMLLFKFFVMIIVMVLVFVKVELKYLYLRFRGMIIKKSFDEILGEVIFCVLFDGLSVC